MISIECKYQGHDLKLFKETFIKFTETDPIPVLGREEAIELIVDLSHPLDIFVASTGMTFF